MVHLILILTLPLHEKRTPVGVLFSLYKALMNLKRVIGQKVLLLMPMELVKY